MSTQSLLYLALIVVMFISLYAQSKVQRVFNKYSSEPGASGKTADEMAREMIAKYGTSFNLTPVEATSGMLTDHYDPSKNIVNLSEGVYGNTSVSALAVAAHEIGHVMQFQKGYEILKVRNLILPAAQLGSSLAPIIVIVGLIFGLSPLCYVGAFLFGAVLLFQLVTLPMELNASKRGLAMLKEGNYIADEQMGHAKEMLTAAAMTYFWATVSALLSFLRLLVLARSSKRN